MKDEEAVVSRRDEGDLICMGDSYDYILTLFFEEN